MRLTSLAIAACLACDSGAAQTVVAAPPGAPPAAAASPEVVSTVPTSAAPSSPAPAASPQSGASEPRFEGQPGCRFQRPEVWAGGRVEWLGACQKGFADGDGVIVNVVEGAEPERFYGHSTAAHQASVCFRPRTGLWPVAGITAPSPRRCRTTSPNATPLSTPSVLPPVLQPP
jgi:hypothetical protein